MICVERTDLLSLNIGLLICYSYCIKIWNQYFKRFLMVVTNNALMIYLYNKEN